MLTRREWILGGIAAAGTAPALMAWQDRARPGKLKITGVEMIRLDGERSAQTGINGQHQVNPLHIYDELRPKEYADSPNPGTRTANASALYLRLRTDAGHDCRAVRGTAASRGRRRRRSSRAHAARCLLYTSPSPRD